MTENDKKIINTVMDLLRRSEITTATPNRDVWALVEKETAVQPPGPKFKVGDIVLHNDGLFRINEVDSNAPGKHLYMIGTMLVSEKAITLADHRDINRILKKRNLK